jgi:hypothetical protein
MTEHLPNGMPIASIPEALCCRSQWVLWRLDPKEEKPDELTKVPYIDLRKKAKADKPKTWMSFDVALQRWAANPNGWAGIGYEFGVAPVQSPIYTGLDFDNCLDPATGYVADWADKELALLLPTYAEISPSGKGIKLWVETEQTHTIGSADKDAGQIEVYSSGRFFAVTGQSFEDAPPTIAKADDGVIEQIIAREQERRRTRQPQTAPAQKNSVHLNGNGSTNGTYPRLPLPQLVSVLDRLNPDRWSSYDAWLRIGMALHDWAGDDDHRNATVYALFDQYSKERAPDHYGETPEKWASFGKRNGETRIVTVGTLIEWAKSDTSAPDEPPHPAGQVADDDEPAATAPFIALSSFPELPASAQLPDDLGAAACPWLDDYIAFSARWSPRSYAGFHEACGLWILSTIAARRVMLPLGGEKFTNLYIALCARTSLWAKSTAAKIAIETIRAARLSSLLAPDDATPQAFIKRLAAQLPPDYGDLSEVAQQVEQDRLAFAGQRGWFFEEFGEKLSAMMRDGNVMADYRGHFRRFDDCPMSYSYSTIGRGMNTVERPYLALLANLTPADLAPFARKGSSLWGDGFFARYAFVTPPANTERSRARFPDGWREIPPKLIRALRTWHEALGAPDVAVETRLDDKGKIAGHALHIAPVEPQRCTLGEGIVSAFYRYHDALTDLVDAGENTDLDGSYTRFADKAMRIATLLASFSNGGRIELRHWARAQQIAERWRASLHYLIDQLGQSDDSPERVLEDKINRLFARHEALTAREVGRSLHISTGEAERMLDQLVKGGVIQVEAGKRTKRYRLGAATVATVTMSHVSHPAQSCDTSAEPPSHQQEVSQELDSSDRYDIVTVATLPIVEMAPPGYRVEQSGPRWYLRTPGGAVSWHASEDQAIARAVALDQLALTT